MAYTHLLFDHDGVLVDTEHLYFQATQETLANLGAELSLEQYLALQAVGGNAWQVLEDAGATSQEVAAHRAVRNVRYQELIVTQDIEIEGVVETLEALASHFTLAIVTTARQADFDLIHADRNIIDPMSLVLTNKDYARSKPAPDPYLAALEHFDIEPSNALVIEDSQRGLASAVAAGIDCATVYHPFTEPQDFSAATYRIANLRELVSLLDVGN